MNIHAIKLKDPKILLLVSEFDVIWFEKGENKVEWGTWTEGGSEI